MHPAFTEHLLCARTHLKHSLVKSSQQILEVIDAIPFYKLDKRDSGQIHFQVYLSF